MPFVWSTTINFKDPCLNKTASYNVNGLKKNHEKGPYRSKLVKPSFSDPMNVILQGDPNQNLKFV